MPRAVIARKVTLGMSVITLLSAALMNDGHPALLDAAGRVQF
jgi:hypothetical protein